MKALCIFLTWPLLLVAATISSAQDLGSQVNAQLATCGKTCDIRLPAVQQVKWTTTISVPCASNGITTLSGSGPSTALTFAGSGPAIEVSCPGGAAAVNVRLSDMKLVLARSGSETPTSGIHLATFNTGTISDVVIENSPETPTKGADGIFIEGANSITIRNVRITGLRNGIHNVGILLNGRAFSANAIHVFGGEISSNSGCGIFEDGASARLVGANFGNSYIGVTLEDNGSIGDAMTGNACIQSGRAISFLGDYFENFSAVSYQAWIGDSSNQPTGVVFVGNGFVSVKGTLATLNLANSDGATISGNTEIGAIPSFIHHSRRSRRTFLFPNVFVAVGNANNEPPRIPGVSGATSGVLNISGNPPDGRRIVKREH